jgi:hypothetical protein
MRILCSLLLISSLSFAEDLADQAGAILKNNCLGCHGAGKVSGLDLRSRASMLAGGKRGPAIEPKNAAGSRLVRVISGVEGPAMPPGKALAAAEIAVLKQWIDTGAPMADAEWAFHRPVRPAVPAGAVNPVDAFLAKTLADKGLKSGPRADGRTLIRRAYLDLIGLPPTPAQVDAFLADRSPDAFSKVVEELLASPHYGERWGRHWLDVVRYADSSGFEYDRDKPNAWRYRDYVVRAFNQDKPYDRFVKEQLAGDELAPDSPEAQIATGYLRLGLENNIKNEQTRLDELDDLVSTTSNAFLGLTVQCARCHDHKFDPIPQKDYYRLQAVFYGTKAAEFPLVSREQVAAFEAQQKHIAELQKPLKAQLAEIEKPYKDRLLAEKKSKLPDYIQLALRTPEGQRTEGQRLNAIQVEKTLAIEEPELAAALIPGDAAKRKAVQKQIADLEAQRPQPFASAMAIAEKGREPEPSYLLIRGGAGNKGEVMKPGVISAASWRAWDFPAPPAEAQTSWRRRAFAEWVASPENPLTARVMVNRIWQNHFGEGIVRTPNNFGKMGDLPTHPELLDWLATEFVKQGWSIKAMHRLMMNSEAYQRSSDDIAENLDKDGENRYLWRMPRRRIESEGIRDAMLAVAGNLDLKEGGPAIHPYIDPALFQSSSKRTWVGKPDTDPENWRRSVYVFSKRSIPLPMLDIFDKPDSVASCARRNRSTIATQALIMMNNKFVMMEAGKFAERLKREAGADAAAQVRLAFLLAVNRPPTHSEAERAVAFIQGDPQGLTDFCQTVFNLNEFVYLP